VGQFVSTLVHDSWDSHRSVGEGANISCIFPCWLFASVDFLTLEDGAARLSRNVSTGLPLGAA
jgi:hypothetical protein